MLTHMSGQLINILPSFSLRDVAFEKDFEHF